MSDLSLQMPVQALFIGEFEDDRLLALELFRSMGWRHYEARQGRRRAMRTLQRYPVSLVVVEANSAPWPWQKMLEYLHRLPNPPQLIVSSRTAGETLWAEVLNKGGLDVLACPFDREELQHVILSACRRFSDQRSGTGRRASVRTARAV